MIPYSHPTSVMIVDDDSVLLKDISEFLADSSKCHSFLSPIEALRSLILAEKKEPSDGVTNIAHVLDKDDYSRQVFHFETTPPLDAGTNENQVSVIIVDYDMPEMNGVEFCNKIKNGQAKKILLTAVADSDVAISAFNAGVIDCFLYKFDPDLPNKLLEAISSLKDQYFKDNAAFLNRTADYTDMGYIHSDDFEKYFLDLQKQYDIEEYYPSIFPRGFIFFTKTGERKYLLIMTDEELRHHGELMSDYAASADLLEKINSRAWVAFFPTPDGFYDKKFDANGEKFMAPAQSVGKWVCGVVDVPEISDSQ